MCKTYENNIKVEMIFAFTLFNGIIKFIESEKKEFSFKKTI